MTMFWTTPKTHALVWTSNRAYPRVRCRAPSLITAAWHAEGWTVCWLPAHDDSTRCMYARHQGMATRRARTYDQATACLARWSSFLNQIPSTTADLGPEA